MKKTINLVVSAQAASDGAGVKLMRAIGTQNLRNLDPFLMLDHFGSDHADDYIAGFPDHPHRGFITLTYMIDGHMLHQDSMGNKGHLKAGDVQWMKAASGVIHSEMPQQERGLMRGFQLWINLPANEKMSAPEYQEFSSDKIPTSELENGSSAKVISGCLGEVDGIVKDPLTDVHYFDFTLMAGSDNEISVPHSHSAFVYVYEGSINIGDNHLAQHQLGLLTSGDYLSIHSEIGGRFIFVSGKPINEPVVQYGPFVMSTESEVQQALDDYRNGSLVQGKADFVTQKTM